MKRAILLMLAALLIPALVFAGDLIPKETYYVGEAITINMSNETNRLTIDTPNAHYKLLQTGRSAPFVLKELGEHRVATFDAVGKLLDEDMFTVIDVTDLPPGVISTTPAEPRIGDEILIAITPPPQGIITVTIASPKGAFTYRGVWNDTSFTIDSVGDHTITLKDRGRVLSTHTFRVLARGNASVPTNDTTPLFTLKDSKGNARQAEARLVQTEGRNDLEIIPDRVAKRLVLRGVTETPIVGLDNVPRANVALSSVQKAFAVNIETNFSNGTLTAVAQGTELHKCASWNFTTQTCPGSWQKIMDLIPGQEYTIQLSPGDPGYAETGVASVNTKKPIYRPGETAEIIMVVLDTQGFLVSGANITLIVTDPGNSSTLVLPINETSDGIYEAIYPVVLEGVHQLNISAIGLNVNSSMSSFFLVQQSYEFDILRDTPVTIDPFKGAFNSSITLISNNYTGTFSFTEILPNTFTIENAGGATVTQDNTSYYLTWTGLTNNSVVTYRANAPLITPNLHALGPSFINYSGTVFEEARPWYLAIDPTFLDLGIVAYGEAANTPRYRTWDGSSDSGESNAQDVGANPDWFELANDPNSQEIILGTVDASGHVNVQVWNGSSWGNQVEVETSAEAAYSGMSVAYESQSGRGMVVYRDGTNIPKYRIWNGTAWEAEQSALTTGSNPRWVQLASHPTLDWIALGTQDGGANADVNVQFWNGTAWIGNQEVVPDAFNPYRNYDLEWSSNDQLIVIHGDNDFEDVRYSLYNRPTSTWTVLDAQAYSVANGGGTDTANFWMELGSSGANTFIAAAIDNERDIHYAAYSGGAWVNTGRATAQVDNIPAQQQQRVMDLDFETTSNAGMIVYGEDNTNNIRYRTWTVGGGWSGEGTISDIGNRPMWVDLAANPANDEMLVITLDSGSDVDLHSWTGSAWADEGELSNGGVTNTRLGVAAIYEGPSDFPPTVTLNIPAASYWNDTSDPFDVTFNCSITDDTNATNISLWLTNSQNTSFAFNDSCTISPVNGSCQWIKSLANGNYTWNCLGYDSASQTDWGVNRTILINYTIPPPSGPAIINASPANGSAYGFGQLITISANITDAGGVDTVRVNLTFPNTTNIFTDMTNTGGDIYSYTFRAWQRGEYYYGIWANDSDSNVTYLDPFFYILGNATINVTVEQDVYNASVIVNLLDSSVSSNWWNNSFRYRKNFTFREPQGLARTDEHVRINITFAEGKLGNENGTVMLCDGTQVPWDAYALTATTDWVTELQGLVELDFTANENITCTLYYDPYNSATETAPATTGWGYACDDSSSGSCGDPADVTPANVDFMGTYSDLNLDPITCDADDTTFYHNLWCYFKAPDSGLQTFGVASDDGSNLTMEETLVIDNTGCQATTCTTGTYNITKDHYYALGVWYDEQGGQNDLYAYYNPTVCSGTGDGSGNTIGNECYRYFGDEWLINSTEGIEERVPSVLENSGNTNVSGYLLMTVESNSSGSWVTTTTILNDTQTSTLRNLTAGQILNIATLWNAIGWNTSLGNVGFYRAYAAFLDNESNVLFSQNNISINDSDIFEVLNAVPIVVSVDLQPLFPLDSSTLNCSFNITDLNSGDVLNANVTWYRNNISVLNVTIPVNNGVANSTILTPGNTTIGEFWHCGVTPYDPYDIGDQVNSSIREILLSTPPTVVPIQCEENGSIWEECSNIVYNDVLTGVRVGCTETDIGEYVANATFKLENIEDTKTFFDNMTIDNTSYLGYFYFNNSDITVTDSGIFNLTVTCTDNNGTIGTNYSEWLIPFGNRIVEILTPPTPVNVTQYQFFNVTSRITCVGGECASYNATLDPPDPWDDPGYGYRTNVNLTEPQGLARTDEHVRFNISLPENIIPATDENGTSLYCNGTRVQWDAYAINTSNSWITNLQGVTEVDFGASESKTCYVYYDTNFTRTELALTTTGWGYACDDSFSGTCGQANEVTTGNVDFTGTYSNLNLNPITCNGDGGTFYHNLWCYFLAPDSGLQTLGVASDDGSNLSIEGQEIINNRFCQGTFCRTGTYTFTDDHYYEMGVWYDENGGSNDLYAYYNPTTCGASGDGAGNHIGNECYPYLGGDWEITVAIGARDEPKTGAVPETAGTPFYTIDPNPRQPTDLLCLNNLAGGDVCTTTWRVNATGPVGSSHDLFVEYTAWNYSGLDNTTIIINVTIIGNTPPVVSIINLTPIFPIPIDDLNCSFIITDQNAGDTLTANLTWYRNDTIFNTTIIDVINGAPNIHQIGSANTTLGENWTCGVIAIDQESQSPQVNSSTVEILSNRPPDINQIQCHENSTVWTACSNILFFDELTGVRVNCTDVDGYVTNATFNLTNIPDNNTFFYNTTLDNTTYPGYFYFNNTNITIIDSGTWNLSVICTDDNASSNSDHIDWFVPWGAFVVSLVNPAADTNVQRYAFFEFNVTVSCTIGECGGTNATLDPDQWHNSSYQYRVQINVSEPESLARNNTHYKTNISLPTERLSNENGTIMYCADVQVPWDAYATATSGAWVTVLEGVAEINITADETVQCYVYMDPSFNGTELALTTTGWGYVGAEGYAGASYVDLTTSDVDCTGEDSDGEFPSTICSSTDNIKLNEWCYFRAPQTTASFYVKTESDDGSGMWVDGTLAVADNDGAHGPQWRDSSCGSCSGALSITENQYYALEIDFAENTGGEVLSNRWDTSTGDNSAGNVIDTECYPYYGDEWLLGLSVGPVIEIFKGIVPENSGIPFYTIDPNPREPADLACLADMIRGDTCSVAWQVNATGAVNSSHDFFVSADPLNNSQYVSQANSSVIVITITDASEVGPIVTLNIPSDLTNTSNPSVVFNCSATDNLGLVNLTLYGNFTGNWTANETQSVSGLNDSIQTTKNIDDGTYLWSCRAFDTDGNSAFAFFNRTLTVDTELPTIILNTPTPAQTFTSDNIDFNWTANDNLDIVLTCNLTLDSVVEAANVPSPRGTSVNRTISGVSEGLHFWNVTCIDDSGNTNISETRNFTITDLPPNVTLFDPPNVTYLMNPNVTLAFIANDNNDVVNATLYLNGIENTTKTPIIEESIETFNLTNVAEGRYEWFVNVSDDGNLTGISETWIFYVDTTAPNINISHPPDNHSTSESNISINFTVVDNLADILTCNITVNGTVVDSTFNVTNGTLTTRNVTFQDGISIWNITCIDLAGNSNTSETRTINVSAPPTVTLLSPANNHAQVPSSIDLIYLPWDNSNLSQCTLILNGAFNETNNTPTNGQNNTFSMNLPEDHYTWAVNCSDAIGLWTVSETWNFTIDATIPNTTLNAPASGSNLLGAFHLFNFTVTDNLDDILICNLSVDGNVSGNTNFNATNNTLTTRNFTVMNEGIHFWYVVCRDDANNTNTSETWNFTTVNPPEVTLQLPLNGTVTNINDINFSYYVFDSTGLANTTLILNGQNNETNLTPTNDAQNNFTLLNLPDGVYIWNVNATDTDNLSGTAAASWTLTIDTTPPNITPYYPPNGTIVTNNTVTFNFTVTDELTAIIACNFTTNGTTTELNVTNSSLVTIERNLTDGNYNWSVLCLDIANNSAETGPINYTVAAPPIVQLLDPLNNTRTNNSNWLFTYYAHDVFGLENCSLLLDGVVNVSTGSPLNGQNNSFLAVNITEGTHNWTILCYDVAPDLNSFSPVPWIFHVDQSGPNILLYSPAPSEIFNDNNVTFNWTAIDFPGSNIICNLTVSNATNSPIIVPNINGISNTTFETFVEDLSDGTHYWNVTCIDDLNNSNISLTREFVINQPDLLLNDSGLSFNETNPDPLETINISANVSNTGGIPATNAVVMFWDGDPLAGGIFIGNYTLTVPSNSSRIFSVLWNITAGFHTIYVSADPNGTIAELNETNNNATINISYIVSNITAPQNDTVTIDTTPQISFNLSDFTAGTMDYTIFVNGVANGQTGTVADGVNTSLNISALADGIHLIIVEAEDPLGRRKNSTPLTITVDTSAPVTVFITPNATWFNTPNVSIAFNTTDDTSITINYTVFFNGQQNESGITLNGTYHDVNFTDLPEGPHTVIIQAEDQLGNIGNSTELTFYVDLTNPEPNITTANETWFNDQTPSIDFIITDNLDPTLNYSFFVDDVVNVNGSVANDTASSTSLATISEGTHTIILQAFDEAGNYANSTPIIIHIDVTPPNVTLISPPNNTNLTQTTVTLNFTVVDNFAAVLNCSILLDGITIASNLNVTNDTVSSTFVSDLASGFHYWNVTCIDNATNAGISETWQFFVELPDLVITSGNITFSNSTPVENQTIEINATIFNLGNLNTTNITVQFWLGDPDLGGTQINGNITIASLNISQNTTVNVSHIAVVGLNQIYVVVDPPTLTNGSIQEENETNNKANRDFTVGLFEVFAGGSENLLLISDASIIAAFTWNQTDVNGSNVFVADTDSSVTFTSLYAIGVNITDGIDVGGNDFEEIDTVMGTSAFPDSVNNTFTAGGLPEGYRNITAFKRLIVNVPVVNSTNTTAFQTGIVWDAADGGNFYNGSQDVVFVTVMNASQQGQYGVYDYEIKVPATLRDYIPGGGTVSFYTELR